MLLYFLRRSNRFGTANALEHDRHVSFAARTTLRRMVAEGRWAAARGHVARFLPRRGRGQPMGDGTRTLLRFIARLRVLDDKQPESNLAAVRLEAAEIVEDLVVRAPEFGCVARSPRRPAGTPYAIPFSLGNRWRLQRRQNVCQIPASLIARRFLQKERHPSPWQSSEPMAWLDKTIGIPDAPVVETIDEKREILISANAETHHSSQRDCYTGGLNGGKSPRTAGGFGNDVVGVVDRVCCGMDRSDAFEMLSTVSKSMASLIESFVCGEDHSALADKIIEHDKQLTKFKIFCTKSFGGTCGISTGADSASSSCSGV